MLGLKVSILFLVGLLCIQKGESLKKDMKTRAGKIALMMTMVENYHKINEYLSSNVQSDDPKSNFAAAREWLDELNKGSQSRFAIRTGSKEALKAALQQFLSLESAVDSGKCDQQTLRVVEENDFAAGMPRIHNNLSKVVPRRRIDRVVYYYAGKHYDTCYFDLLSMKVDQLNPTSLGYLMAMGAELVRTSTFPKHHRNFGASTYATVIRHLVNVDAAGGETSKDTLKKFFDKRYEITRNDFEKYIVTPCEEVKPLVGEDFNTELNPLPTVHDVDPSEYGRMREKRAAVQACAYILKYKEQIWKALPLSINFPQYTRL